MYIKDEDLIVENLQKRIENGEEVTLTPHKFSTLFIIIFTFLMGSVGLFSSHPGLRVSLFFWLLTAQFLLDYITKDGQLVLTRKGLKFYKRNDDQEIYWTNVDSLYTTSSKLFNFLTVRLKGRVSIKISRYDYKEIAYQTLIKLCERNFSKSTTP